ncbi:hypothetical protein AB0J80_20065 [Actinoplanes sp. NPDC049548]|uniref:hypothetical protein n=1 Tax=Actinoplanes sp. NPDC049548 TaxID=3155152 RepID=UPI00343940D6
MTPNPRAVTPRLDSFGAASRRLRRDAARETAAGTGRRTFPVRPAAGGAPAEVVEVGGAPAGVVEVGRAPAGVAGVGGAPAGVVEAGGAPAGRAADGTAVDRVSAALVGGPLAGGRKAVDEGAAVGDGRPGSAATPGGRGARSSRLDAA